MGTVWGRFYIPAWLCTSDCAPVHKARSIKTQSDELGVVELDWPAQSFDLNPIEHLWGEQERILQVKPSRPTSVSDLTNALLDDWAKILPETLQNPLEILPRKVETIIVVKGDQHHINVPVFKVQCHWSSSWCNGQVSQYFCPNSLY